MEKRYGFVPNRLITDDMRSYGAAARDLGIGNRHERGRRRNNRVENSHQPTRRKERKLQCLAAMKDGRNGSWEPIFVTRKKA
jgi:transposase-like protein